MNEFVAYLLEVFEQVGPLQARRMFGGHGLFREGLMFGLVADDTLYLKADAQNQPHFEALGLEPFHYHKGDKRMTIAYWQAPEHILEDRDEAAQWGRAAFAAALRADAAKPLRCRKHQPGWGA